MKSMAKEMTYNHFCNFLESKHVNLNREMLCYFIVDFKGARCLVETV